MIVNIIPPTERELLAQQLGISLEELNKQIRDIALEDYDGDELRAIHYLQWVRTNEPQL